MRNEDTILLLIERIERNVKLLNDDLHKVKELLNDKEIKKNIQQYPWNRENKYE